MNFLCRTVLFTSQLCSLFTNIKNLSLLYLSLPLSSLLSLSLPLSSLSLFPSHSHSFPLSLLSSSLSLEFGSRRYVYGWMVTLRFNSTKGIATHNGRLSSVCDSTWKKWHKKDFFLWKSICSIKIFLYSQPFSPQRCFIFCSCSLLF